MAKFNKKDYEEATKEAPSTFGGHAYDAFIILMKGIETAKSTDKEAVRTAIENLKGLVGTAGIFNFSAQDHNGIDINAFSFELITVKKGKFEILETSAKKEEHISKKKGSAEKK